MSGIEQNLREMIRKIVREEIEAVDSTKPGQLGQLTVADYAKKWSISTSTVRQAIREKRLKATRIGRAVRIAADATIGARAGTANERAILTLMRGGKVR